MRHTGRTMFAALVAVLAIGAVGVASASAALPEFVHGTGESFPVAISYTSSSQETAVNQVSRSAIQCRGAKIKGEVTGAKAATVTAELTNCTGGDGCMWHNVGAPEGDVTLSTTGTLGYTNKASKQVGIGLSVKGTEVYCKNDEGFLTGSVTIPIAPVNTKTSSFELKIHAEGIKQEYTFYENELGKDVHTEFEGDFGGAHEAAGLNMRETIKLASSKPLTIDA